jgi:hypothetical protein
MSRRRGPLCLSILQATEKKRQAKVPQEETEKKRTVFVQSVLSCRVFRVLLSCVCLVCLPMIMAVVLSCFVLLSCVLSVVLSRQTSRPKKKKNLFPHQKFFPPKIVTFLPPCPVQIVPILPIG